MNMNKSMKQETDILIDQLRQRNPAACQKLLTDYGTAVFQMVRRIVTVQEDAEEVYQDVFVKALQAIGNFDSRRATLATWLNRIAYHEALNFLRSRKLSVVYMEEQNDDLDDAPDDEMPDELTIQRLEMALTELPPHERTIITMFYYDNMSLADIAYVTDSIPSTIGSQLCRIRKKLYRIIKNMKP